MKRPKYSLAYIQSLQVYSLIVAKSKRRKAVHVTADYNTVNTAQEGTESYTQENVIITDCTFLLNISKRAADIVHRIMAELCFNNALWYFDHTTNTRDAMAIKELRELGVLKHTEDTHIHFVNPDFIRKGNKLLVAANTAMVTAVGKVDRSMIRPLNKKNIELNPVHIAELG